MQPLPSRWDPSAVEASSRAFWTSRGLIDATGPFGPENGPLTHQVLGTIFPFDSDASVTQRFILAGALARLEALSGNRTLTSIELGQDRPGAEPRQFDPATTTVPLKFRVGAPGPESDRGVQALVDRLASSGVLVCHTAPLRTCVACGIAPSPETIVYEDEVGEAYVVRFPVRGDPRGAQLLVWTDAAWKLLGTSAVLVNPDAPYVTARFRRRGAEETVVVARAAVERLKGWWPGSEVEVLEERPGNTWAGSLYDHPLSAGYPLLGELPPPAGGVIAYPGIRDDRTGLVTLTPSHGYSDSQVAQEVQLPGWPVVTADGRIDSSLRHNYVGLSLRDAEAFAMRDLIDSGALFATIPARRGVPHCAACGSELVWIPGRTWTFDPGRLSPETKERAVRLLGAAEANAARTGLPWPIASVSTRGADAGSALLECSSCERLAPAPGAELCECGGLRAQVRRELVPGFREALAATLRQTPFAVGDRLRFILPDRRHDAVVWHLLAAFEAATKVPGEVGLVTFSLLSDVPGPESTTEKPSLDAVRLAAFGRPAAARRSSPLASEQRRQARLVRRLWSVAGEVLKVAIASGYAPEGSAPSTRTADLWAEDRAFLAVVERLRFEVAGAYARDDLGAAARAISRFLDRELPAAWRVLLAYRLRGAGLPPSKSSALRVLTYAIPLIAQLANPLAPFSTEAIYRAFRRDAASVIQGRFAPIPEGLRDPPAEERFVRWVALGDAILRARRRWGIAPDDPLPSLAIQVEDASKAAALRSELEVVRRLARSAKVTVVEGASAASDPTLRVVPVLSELQRAYGAQAPRLAHVLANMPGKRVRDGLRSENLSIALEGQPFPVSASMVEVTAVMPSGWVASPAPDGSLLIELPRGRDSPPPPNLPVLSSDGYRVLERVAQRLRRPGTATDGTVRLLLGGSLLKELSGEAPRLAAEWGVPSLEVAALPDDLADRPAARGRSRKGDRWALVLAHASLRGGRSPKARAPTHRSRFVRRPPVNPPPEEVAYLTDELVAQYGQIREIAEQLENALGTPLVGPTKLSNAWDVGLQSFESFEHAPFEILSPLPGFGRQVAGAIVSHFGGEVPPPPSPARIELAEEPEPLFDPPPVDDSEVEPTPVAGPPAPELSTVPEPPVIPPAIIETPPAPVPRFPEWKPRPAPAPPPKPAEPAAPAAPPPSGGLELAVGTGDAAWERFLDAAAAGHRGLCISREVPDRVRARVGPRSVDVLWLSNAGRENSVRPTDLAAIENAVARGVEDRGVSIVYLAGLEYLLFLHTPDAITGLLRNLDDLGRSKGVRLWSPVEPGLTDAAKLTAVQTGFQSPRETAPPPP